LPLKLNLGNFIEALDKGANTIIMGGGVGPCRFGYYGEVQKEILNDLGYEFEMYVIDPEFGENIKKYKKLFGGFIIKRLFNASRLAWNKILAIDKIHKLILKAMAREKEKGKMDKIYKKFIAQLDYINSIKKIKKLTSDYEKIIKANTGDLKLGHEIKIGIVGEIYMVIEPFTNLEIEKKLGELGAVIDKKIYISTWIHDFLNLDGERKKIKKAARPYLNSFVGGHGLDTIGNTVRYAEKSYDGVIQIAPFTCMPEIVAQTILPEVSKKMGIPVLSLIFDEHSGETGLITRLEAFIDLISRKKREGLVYNG